MRTPYSKCFLSDCVQFHDYYYTFHPLLCSTSKNCMDLDCASMEIKIPCVFFYHKQTTHSTQQLLCYFDEKWHGYLTLKGCSKKCQTLVWIYGLWNKNWSDNPSWFIAQHRLCHGTSWTDMGFSADQYLLVCIHISNEW